jgi:hypothetical protein
VVPQGLLDFFPVFRFGEFQSLFLAILMERFRDLSLGDLVGDICLSPSWFFPFDSPPKYVNKGARFGGFRCPRVSVVLG